MIGDDYFSCSLSHSQFSVSMPFFCRNRLEGIKTRCAGRSHSSRSNDNTPSPVPSSPAVSHSIGGYNSICDVCAQLQDCQVLELPVKREKNSVSQAPFSNTTDFKAEDISLYLFSTSFHSQLAV